MFRLSNRSALVRFTAHAIAVGVSLGALPGVAGAQTTEVLHSLAGRTDGAQPQAPLIQGADGHFYGTTSFGGSAALGTVFKITSGGTFTVLHQFVGGSDGAQPFAPLLQAADGNFYGTTRLGGAANKGTVFRMTPGGDVTVLHAFGQTVNDGAYPSAGLIQARDGNFYGTTGSGGNGYGTIFTMTPGGALTVLYASFGRSTGAAPRGRLLEASDGNLYGTTTGMNGSPYCCGTAFRFTTSGTFVVIHAFELNGVAFPSTPLIEGSDGYLYGISGNGSYPWTSQIYRMSLNGDVTALPMPVGYYPVSALTQGSDGAFYGAGGAQVYSFGMLFRMTASGAFAVRHVFAGRPLDGAIPLTELTLGSDGNFYGTTRFGGASNEGVVFRFDSTRTAESAGPSLAADFDGDGRTDLTVYRPTTGEWFVRYSTSNYSYDNWTSYQWGLPGDIPLAADFDGDGKTDLTVYRPTTGEWFVRYSTSNYSYGNWTSYQWGLPGDVPLAADFDGDGKTDLVVFRPNIGTWYVRFSSSNYSYANWTSYQWGLLGDVPLAADLDGDRKSDLVVYRPWTGEWFVRFSTSDYSYATWTSYQWGLPGDLPVAADFDGDGKTDLSVWRPLDGTWYVRFSSSAYGYATWTSYQWGLPGDRPLVGDFDGDGKTDLSVWRPVDGTWYVRFSTSGYSYDTWLSYQWGLPGDTPL